MKQNPQVAALGNREALATFLLLGATAGIAYGLAGFEIAVLATLVLGISILSGNISAAAAAINVHLVDVRDNMLNALGAELTGKLHEPATIDEIARRG